MSAVFKAIDTSTRQIVAVKVPCLHDSVFRERFEREIDIGQMLDHPAILKVLPVNGRSRLYLVMEYVEGQTLWDRLRHERPLPVDEALSIAARLCDAVEHLRRHQVSHRDLKPAMASIMRARLVGDPVAPRSYNAALSPQVEEIVLRALARDPNDRYLTAFQFRADLERPAHVLLTGRASRLQPVSLPSQTFVVARMIVFSLLTPVALFFFFLLLFSRQR